MAIDIAGFRETYTEFTSTTTYPDIRVQMWLDFSVKTVNVNTWGDLYEYGVYTLTAHQLIMTNPVAAASTIGISTGVVNSKSVGGVSVSYNNSMINVKAGTYGLTLYGLQYWQMVQLIGAGPLQLSF